MDSLLTDFYIDLNAKQTRLPDSMYQILDTNFWDLVIKEEPDYGLQKSD